MCFEPPTSAAGTAGTQAFDQVAGAQQQNIDQNLMPAIAAAQSGAAAIPQGNSMFAQAAGMPVASNPNNGGLNPSSPNQGPSYGGGQAGGQMAMGSVPGVNPMQQQMGRGINPQMFAALMNTSGGAPSGGPQAG